MSENNVENTSFKIDDVSEEKSQFEIDNERRAQLEREQEQEQESVEQVDDMQENQDEEQESQEEQVQEQAPIHISHETQIVDNFFDGPPPVRKTANQNHWLSSRKQNN